MNKQWATTYFGAHLLCDGVDIIQRTIAAHGVWEPDVSHVIEKRLRHGDVFVDVGANIGYDSLLAASCVGPMGSVVAIEAAPATYDLLCNNIAANDYANIRPVWVAVADRFGEATLYEYGPTNTGATTTMAKRRMFRDGDPERAFHGTPVGTATAAPLIEILSPIERVRARIIKIDVEGAEGPIVADILKHLDKYPENMEILVEVDPELYDWDGLLGALVANDFAAYQIKNDYTGYHQISDDVRLKILLDVPTEQVDLLLTRQM